MDAKHFRWFRYLVCQVLISRTGFLSQHTAVNGLNLLPLLYLQLEEAQAALAAAQLQVSQLKAAAHESRQAADKSQAEAAALRYSQPWPHHLAHASTADQPQILYDSPISERANHLAITIHKCCLFLCMLIPHSISYLGQLRRFRATQQEL